MATKVNFYENYGDKSARERAELIYVNADFVLTQNADEN